MTDPTNVFAMDDVKFMTGFNVEPVVASEAAIADAISRFYGGGSSNGEELTVSIASPLCGAKADIATHSTDFAFGPKAAVASPRMFLRTPLSECYWFCCMWQAL